MGLFSDWFLLWTHCTMGLWAHGWNLSKIIHALINHQFSNQVTNMHMSQPQQLSCCGMCKIATWSSYYFSFKRMMYILQNLYDKPFVKCREAPLVTSRAECYHTIMWPWASSQGVLWHQGGTKWQCYIKCVRKWNKWIIICVKKDKVWKKGTRDTALFSRNNISLTIHMLNSSEKT